MSRARLATIAICLLVWPAAQGLGAEDEYGAVARRIAEARRTLGAPGISAAVVLDDKLLWSGADGLADVENEVPARPSTVYRIASISKPIAATAVLQLVEAGKLSLDDSIWKFVPSLPRHGDSVITVRHLLTHTSGIRHYRYEEEEKENTRSFSSFEETLKIYGVYDEPLLFRPGTRFLYSTFGYNLLAGVVESASGRTYEAYLKERVFGPAEMSSTRLDHPLEIVPKRGRQYRKGAQPDRPTAVTNAPYADLSFKWAGGGLLSTVEDLARFHIALDRGRLLQPATLEQAYRRASLEDGTKTDYGLGWWLRDDNWGKRWVGHSGAATGGSAFLARMPERGLAVAIICNVEKVEEELGRLSVEIATRLLVQQKGAK